MLPEGVGRSYQAAGSEPGILSMVTEMRCLPTTNQPQREKGGVRVLSNEKVEVDGLQIISVPYGYATRNGQLASVLHDIGLDRDRARILLTLDL
jgi:hypothetical protein